MSLKPLSDIRDKYLKKVSTLNLHPRDAEKVTDMFFDLIKDERKRLKEIHSHIKGVVGGRDA